MADADATTDANVNADADAAGAPVTAADLRALVRVAGLPLDEGEIAELLPLYQYLRQRVDALHDASLPLGAPAATFAADWRQ